MTTTHIDLDVLVSEQLITDDQKRAILNWQKKSTHREWTSRFIQIFATFGAIVTGLGVILLIAANWDTISDMTKTLLMIGATGITYILGYYLSYMGTHYTKTGQALILLGSLLYGASIFLLGQVYNLGGTFADAFLIWALPIILLAYTTQFTTIFILAITLIYAYIFSVLGEGYGFSGFVIADVFIAVGYLSLSLLRYHREIYRHFSWVLTWTGGASVLGGLFAYTFLDFWRYGGDSWYTGRDIQTTIWILCVIVWAWVIAIIIDIVYKKKLDITADVPLLLSLVPIGLIFVYTLNNIVISPIYDPARWDDMTMYNTTVLMNILYLAILSLMIYLGVRRDNRSLVNIAMIFLALYLFGKYVAFAYDSKMDGAYIFIGGGIACIILTILVEWIRRRIVKTME